MAGNARKIRRGRVVRAPSVFRPIARLAIGDALSAPVAQKARLRRGGSDPARMPRARLARAGGGAACLCDSAWPPTQAHSLLSVSQQARTYAAGSPRWFLEDSFSYRDPGSVSFGVWLPFRIGIVRTEVGM